MTTIALPEPDDSFVLYYSKIPTDKLEEMFRADLKQVSAQYAAIVAKSGSISDRKHRLRADIITAMTETDPKRAAEAAGRIADAIVGGSND